LVKSISINESRKLFRAELARFVEALAESLRLFNKSLSDDGKVLRGRGFSPIGKSHLETRIEVSRRVSSRHDSQSFVRHSILSWGDLAGTSLLLTGLENLELEISPSVGLSSQGQSLKKDRFTTSSESKLMSVVVRCGINVLRIKWSDIFSVLLHESKTVFTKFTDR
jgi:hypothetical protein